MIDLDLIRSAQLYEEQARHLREYGRDDDADSNERIARMLRDDADTTSVQASVRAEAS